MTLEKRVIRIKRNYNTFIFLNFYYLKLTFFVRIIDKPLEIFSGIKKVSITSGIKKVFIPSGIKHY